MTYPVINGSEINGAEGFPSTNSLRPVTFGAITLHLRLPASSLDAVVSFGQHMALRGMPPADQVLYPQSLYPATLGAHAISAALTLPAPASLEPVAIGAITLRMGLSAAGLAPVALGAHGMNMGATGVQSLRPVTLGAHSVRMSMEAQSLYAGTLPPHGSALSGIELTPQSLYPVTLGAMALGAMGLRARSLRPVTLPRHAISRESTC
jgi:hypothetical protein